MAFPRAVNCAFLAASLVVFLTGVAERAQAEDARNACPAMPDVSWWTSDHQDVIELVNTRYGGDWRALIDNWREYERRMVAIHDQGSAAVVNSRGLRFEGAALAEHIEKIRTRIAVTRCLALENDPDHIAGFETAAGGDDIPPPEPIVSVLDLATTRGDRFRTRISARCEDRAAVFQLANLDEAWPDSATVSLFVRDGDDLVSERRLRLSKQQNVTFQAKPDMRQRNGSAALRIDPAWTGHHVRYETAIVCD